MLRRKFALLVLVTLCLQVSVPALPSHALMERYTLDRLTRESTQIVWGQVLSVAPHWNLDQTNISSSVTLAVNEYLKGGGPDQRTLEVPGGVIDGVGQWVEDAPTFVAGEEAIVFMRGEAAQIVGWAQGKYTCAEGRVVEAGMLPVEQFIGQIQGKLAEEGATPASLGEKGESEARRVRWAGERLEQATVPHLESPSEDSAALSPQAVQPAGWQTIFAEGFESDSTGAWAVSGNPTWGSTSYRAYAGTRSGYCARLGTLAVDAPGPYRANMVAWMVYGPFSLVGVVDADVQFRHYTKTEASCDYLTVKASLDGTNFFGVEYSGNWTTASGNVNGWMAGELDLAALPGLGNLCGQSQVYVAVGFQSDGSFEFEGAYLDDLLIRKDTGGTVAPVITTVTPNARAAGIGQQVTLTGTSFGSAQGNSDVSFHSGGSTWVAAPIVSWSNTQVTCRVPAGASSHSTQGIRLTNASGSSYAGFTIKWSYQGSKWPGNPVLVRYYLGSGTDDCTGENAAIKQAANSWTTVDLTYHALKYWGTTTRGAPLRDGYNVVRWGATEGSIATTTTWYDLSTGALLEFDTVISDSYTWSSVTPCPPGRMDVCNTMAHEFGHGGVGMADLYGNPDAAKTMYAFTSTVEMLKRSLHADDIAGAQWIY